MNMTAHCGAHFFWFLFDLSLGALAPPYTGSQKMKVRSAQSPNETECKKMNRQISLHREAERLSVTQHISDVRTA
jgi:hypothetical protein